MILCAVFDRVSRIWFAPSMEHNEDSAKRTFDIIKRSPGMVKESPGDFDFYKIGEYDQATGVVAGCDHTLICAGTPSSPTTEGETK